MTVPQDPYFQRAGLQLIDMPASSRAAVAAAGQKQPASLHPGLMLEARSWANVLNPAYAPGPEVPFLEFPQEDGAFDVLRAAYRVGTYDIEVAQTKHLLSIEIRGVGNSEHEPEEQRADAVARVFLGTPIELHFEILETIGARTFGKVIVPKSGPAHPSWPDWQDWIDDMRFWSEADRVGFLTVKAPGGPVREVIGIGDAQNKTWFR
jgi:hypothetical protein